MNNDDLILEHWMNECAFYSIINTFSYVITLSVYVTLCHIYYVIVCNRPTLIRRTHTFNFKKKHNEVVGKNEQFQGLMFQNDVGL